MLGPRSTFAVLLFFLSLSISSNAQDTPVVSSQFAVVDLAVLRAAIAAVDQRAGQLPAISQLQRNQVHVAVSQMRASLGVLQSKVPSIGAEERYAYRTAVADLVSLATAASAETDASGYMLAVEDLRDDLAIKSAKRQKSGAYPNNSILVRVTVNTVDASNRSAPGYNIGLSPMRWANEGFRVTFAGVTAGATGMVVPGLYKFTAYREKAVGGVSERIRIGAGGATRETVAIIVR